MLKVNGGGDNEGGGVGNDGGGTEISTLDGRGTTPDIVQLGDTGNWSW